MKTRHSPSRSRRLLGQSTVEYIVVVAFSVLVLIEGGNSSPVQEVVTAVKQAYKGFSHAISFSTNFNAF